MKKSIIFIFAAFVLMSMNSCYYNWSTSTEEKQAYQFTLLKREFISHPEKLDKSVLVIITDHKGSIDTLSSTEVDKLMSYPPVKRIEFIVPYGGPYNFILTYYEGGKIGASISKTIWGTKVVFNKELYRNTGEGRVRKNFIIGKRSWPYIYGKKGTDLVPDKIYNDNEREEAISKALAKMVRIVKNI